MAGTHPDGEDGGSPRVCPASRVFDLVAHKWTVTILHHLHAARGPIRFRQLQRLVDPITQKELTKRLRELERSGLVERTVFAEVPPRVEYRLTDLGATLIPALDPLHQWAVSFADVVDANRRAADEARAKASGVGAMGPEGQVGPLRTAYRSFAEVERGLPRRSSGEGRTTSGAIEA